MGVKKKHRLTYVLLLSGITLWVVAIVLTPVFHSKDGILRLSGLALRQVFAPVCHQNPARSFLLSGEPLAVCSRCTGIYFGFWLGFLVYPLFYGLREENPVPRSILALAFVPMAVDVFIEVAGWYASSLWVHAITGFFAGMIVAFVVLPGALSTVSWIIDKKRLL